MYSQVTRLAHQYKNNNVLVMKDQNKIRRRRKGKLTKTRNPCMSAQWEEEGGKYSRDFLAVDVLCVLLKLVNEM